MIENVSNELKKYFEGKPVISSLIGLDMVLLYGCVALMLLGTLIGIGSFLNALLFYGLMLSILLCLANKNFKALMIGLGAMALVSIVELIVVLSGAEVLSWEALFGAIVYGFFAYLSYNKTLAK